jgi:hypothetical protein
LLGLFVGSAATYCWLGRGVTAARAAAADSPSFAQDLGADRFPAERMRYQVAPISPTSTLGVPPTLPRQGTQVEFVSTQ